MNRPMLFLSTFVAASVGLAPMVQAGTMAHYWSEAFGDVGEDAATAAGVNANGDVYVAGFFEGTINLGGGDLTSNGGRDVFLVKYDRFGGHVWSQGFGGAGWDVGTSVEVDNLGYVVITGYFQSAAEFGGATLISEGSNDIFVAKYDANGAHQWSYRYGGTGDDTGSDLALGADGSIALTGEYGDGADLGGGPLSNTGVGPKTFLARYDSFGTHFWSVGFDGTLQNLPGGVAVSPARVVVGGYFRGSADFGVGLVASAGSDEMYLVSYDPSGNHEWSHTFGAASADQIADVAINDAGDIVIVGHFSLGTIDLGGGPLTTSEVYTPVLAKFTGAGGHVWSQAAAGTGFPDGVVTDGNGDILIAGYFPNTLDLGGGDLTSVDAFDVFVGRYDGSGAHEWSSAYGGSGDDAGSGLALDSSGRAIVVGRFDQSIDFGGYQFNSMGNSDAFVAKWLGEIEIGQLEDQANDRGTAALMVWVKHVLDGPPIPIDPPMAPITNYSIWRATGGLPMYPPDPVCPAPSTPMAAVGTTTCNGWERVANVLAAGNEEYNATVPTTRDATPGDAAVHYFVILAEDDQGGYRVSPPDSVSTTNDLGAAILSITDVPNDNGRWVSIAFARDTEDAEGATTPVLSYEVYRRDDAPPTSAGASPAPGEIGDGPWRIDGWTYVASAPAHGDSSYSVDAPTVGDSTIAAGAYNSTFFVRATTITPSVFFDSPAFAGYSLDNLAPAAPAGLAHDDGVLSWGPSGAPDFSYHTVYGNTIDDFGGADIVDYTTEESLDVSASGYAWFFVTATDFSGNEGPYSMLDVATGVGFAPHTRVLSVSNYPNPFNPTTTVRYTVPASGRVTVSIYNTRGVRVATLVYNEPHDAGAYAVPWNGHGDDGARLASGVYFARVEHPVGVRSRKVVLLK